MENLIAKLSDHDMSMIERYVQDYGSYHHAPMTKLLRYWDNAKSEYLYRLLGNQFQVSKEFEYNKGVSSLRRGLMKYWEDSNSACARFRRIFDRFMWDNRIALGSNYYKLQKLMETDCLLNQSYDEEEFSVNTPDGKSIKIQKGCRPLRMIARVAKAYGGLNLVDEFQTEVSLVLNQKKLKGTITLSIHPLDYMTMSDNWSDWSSCMSWQEEGCYRRGTVEMMNSRCVLVAYLASADRNMEIYDMNGHKCEWNNKKWRELFIVTPEVITGVKGYPYQNDDLVQTINSWIKELAEANLGWNYCANNTKYQHREAFNYVDTNGETQSCKLYFSTCTMYNDFGTIDQHWCIMGEHADDYVDIDYSGAEICLCCGDSCCDFDGEGALVCYDCDGDHSTCEECGCRMYEDDMYELDGSYYCESCYQNLAEIDVLTEDEHNRRNMYWVQIVPEGTQTSDLWTDVGIGAWMYEPNKYNWSWNEHFNIDEPRNHWAERLNRWGYTDRTSVYYVFPSDFKDIDDIEEYYPDIDISEYTK